MEWHPSLRPTGKPRYLEIAEAIRSDIETGVLSPGDRLPSQRSVAQTLGLDFTTVSRGYAQAAKCGYVESFVGRGTFVRALDEGAEDPDPRRALAEDPMMNMPPEPEDPVLVARMEQGLKHVSANLVPLLRYQSTSGSLQDREAAAQWMLENGIPISSNRLVVTPGAHSSVHAVLTHLSEPGLTVLCERVTYPGIRAIATQLGLRLFGVDMDEHGIRPDALGEAIQKHWPAAVYLNPTLQNPLTFTMPADRRKQVAQILAQHGTPLVEDDACCFVASDAPAPISTLVPELGWHIAGLSKCLGAGLRLAFTTIPENHPKEPFLQVLRAGSVMASPLSMALVSRWIGDGTARMMLTAIRKGAAERQAVAIATLGGCRFRHQSEAFNIWLTLPPGISRAEIMGRMSNAQIGILPSDTFTVSDTKDEAIRVCLGGPISLTNLTDDLETLRDAVQHKGWIG